MAATNETQDPASLGCQLIKPFHWRQEYIIETGVYLNLILLAAINSVMFPFTTFFNLLFVYIIFVKREMRRRKIYVSIGYLAITDLAVGVVLQPMLIAVQLCRISGRCNLCVLDFVVWFIATVICRSSMNHLVMVAWERYVAIKYALRYDVIVTRKRLLWASIAAWLIPLLQSLLFLQTNPLVILIFFSVYILICFSILAYFYWTILIESRRHRRQIKATTPHAQGEANRSITQEFRASKTTFIIISCFAICYAPVIVGVVVRNVIDGLNLSSNSVFSLIVFWTGTLLLFNSLINPLIYGWRCKEIKKMVKDIIAARVNKIKTEDAQRKKRVRPKSSKRTEKTQRNNTLCSLSVRRSERSLSIPTNLMLTSSASVKPNKRRRHTLQAVVFINTVNSDAENQYSFHSQSDHDLKFKTRENTENEQNMMNFELSDDEKVCLRTSSSNAAFSKVKSVGKFIDKLTNDKSIS